MGASSISVGMSPGAFAGSMSACLGDMMETLVSGGRQTVLTVSSATAPSTAAAASRATPDSQASPDLRIPSSLSFSSLGPTARGGGGGGDAESRVPHPAAPLPEFTASILAPRDASHSPTLGLSPLGWSLTAAGGGQHLKGPSPMLNSPTLHTKTKLQPIMSTTVGPHIHIHTLNHYLHSEDGLCYRMI